MIVRTWSGSVIQLRKHNFWPWFKGWARWTIQLRPRVPSHVDQPEAEIGDKQWPKPVKPWRSPSKNFSEGY